MKPCESLADTADFVKEESREKKLQNHEMVKSLRGRFGSHEAFTIPSPHPETRDITVPSQWL
jgi:hypothetical protein